MQILFQISLAWLPDTFTAEVQLQSSPELLVPTNDCNFYYILKSYIKSITRQILNAIIMGIVNLEQTGIVNGQIPLAAIVS